MKRHHGFLSLALLFISAAYAQESETFRPEPEAAVSVVRATYAAEKWQPQSSTIHTVEYFPASPRKVLIVTFHRREGGTSKPYLYEGVPADFWRAWRVAPSAGTWYHANLKGKQKFFFRGR